METNYDKVEQSNGGKSMRFFEYLKKQEPSKENEEARKQMCIRDSVYTSSLSASRYSFFVI